MGKKYLYKPPYRTPDEPNAVWKMRYCILNCADKSVYVRLLTPAWFKVCVRGLSIHKLLYFLGGSGGGRRNTGCRFFGMQQFVAFFFCLLLSPKLWHSFIKIMLVEQSRFFCLRFAGAVRCCGALCGFARILLSLIRMRDVCALCAYSFNVYMDGSWCGCGTDQMRRFC